MSKNLWVFRHVNGALAARSEFALAGEFNYPYFEKYFKNKDFSHIFSANRNAEKIKLSKKDFFDSLNSGLASGVFLF